jgi:regulation of enolase protein 1 (concanavalin A-like superfamily)
MREWKMTRRALLSGAAALGVASAVPGVPAADASHLDAGVQQTLAPDQDEWMNEPRKWKKKGTTLTATADAKTDFWRKTFYGYITDNGHFYHRRVSGDFSTSVKFEGEYHDLYDQAGLMVRLDDLNWMKCGVEFVDGKPHMSVVFTRDFSDWSTYSLGELNGPMWLRVERKKDSLDIFHSLDGKNFLEDRMGYFAPSPHVLVGPMLAAPEGKGFDVRFDDWTVGPPTPQT